MARIGEMLGWSDNPWYQLFDANRGAVSGAARGALSSPSNPWAGASYGMEQGGQADEHRGMLEKQEEERQAQINATAQFLRSKGAEDLAAAVEGGMTTGSDAFNQWYSTQNAGESLMSVGGHIYNRDTGEWISPPESAENRQNVSLTPQWGQDAEGNPVMLQPSSTGDLVQSQVPEGVTLLGPFGTSADRSAGTAFGKGVGGAQFDLPAAAVTTQQTLSAIENVRNQAAGMDEQFGNVMGVPQQWLPTMPQSARANFQIETNRLINRTFLEAREVLRGGGQITDFESRKAEGAISNLEEAMARGDKALFVKSLNELEQAVRDGYAKLQAQAAAIPGYGGQPAVPAANTTSSGLQWSIEP